MDLLMDWIVALLARRGIDFADGGKVGDLLRAAGLAHVAAHDIGLPFGEYNDRTARLLATDFFNGVKAYGGLLQGIATPERFTQVLARARADTASPQTGCLSRFHIAYGQRPA